MTKKQILELTGLSESEFYKKYPTKESFEKDAENYKKGGIYIKPENRGKFTATKKRTGKTTEELTHSKNPLTRKRAIFAQNAKKWKHAEGGSINPELLKNISGSLSQLGNMKMGQSQAGQPPQQGNVGKTIGSVVGGIAGSFIPIPGVGTALGSTVGGMIGGAIDKKSYQNNLEDYNVMNAPSKNSMPSGFKKGGELIKRADGSYSRRGLWDNIRANRGSGKKPTAEMLKQEAKIKAQEKAMGGNVYADGGKLPKNILKSRLESHMSTEQANAYLKKYAKGGKLEHLGDNLYKVKSYIKGTDKVEVRPNVFFDDKEVVRKNPDGSMQILSDDLGYAKPVEKVAKAMGGKAAQSLFNTMYTKQEMSKARRPVDKFADNANKRKSYVAGGKEDETNYSYKKDNNIPRVNAQIDEYNYYNNPEKYLKSKDEIKQFQAWIKKNKQIDLGKYGKNKDGIDGDLGKPGSLTRNAWNTYGDKFIESKGRKVVKPIKSIPFKLNTNTNNSNNSIISNNTNNTPIYPTPDFQLPKDQEPIYPTPDLKEPKYPEPRYPTPDMKAPQLPQLPQSKEYQMKQISPWWLAASEAGNIANMLMSRPDDVNLDRYKPTLVDPYRANKLLASELRKQANAASSAIRGTANTQGTYLASEIANRSRLNEAIGSQLAQSNLQSLLSNTDLINKAKLANVDISTMEKDLRQREKDASRSIRSQALSQMGSNIMQYGRDRKQVDQTNAMLPYIAGENYYFKDENGNPVIMRKYNPFEEGSKFNPYFTQEKAGEKKRFGGKIKKK